MAPRTLIIGINGFVGAALARQLLAHQWPISGTYLPGTPAPGIPGARLHACHVDRTEEFADLLASHEVVVNAAGNLRGDRSADYADANVRVPEILVSQLKNLSTPPFLIHLSSVAAIGPTQNNVLPDESAPCHPVSLYGRTKRAGEQHLLAAAAHNPHLPLLIIRPPSLFGPGDPCFFDLFVWVQRGFALKLCTRHKVFNLLYIDDLVEIIRRLCLNRSTILHRSSPLLHIGFAEQISDDEFSSTLGAICGKNLRTIFLPPGLCRILARLDCLRGRLGGRPALFSPSKVDEMSHACWLQNFDSFCRLFSDLRPTPLVEAMKQTYAWYQSQGWLP